jgi:hypothetical protein
LFKVYQTPDLANLGMGSPQEASDGNDTQLPTTTAMAMAATAPELIALRDALYSEPFRALVSRLSGCGALEVHRVVGGGA